MQRLGKNIGRYFGEGIEIEDLLREMASLARGQGWTEDWCPAGSARLLMLRRSGVPGARRKLYISAGIHGDEPAGPLALLELFRDKAWPSSIDLFLCPCLNPGGFPLNTRENAAGVDLNRDYRDLRTPEVQAHVAWLEQQPRFDVSVCLHEDWEANGFYIYELLPGGGRSHAAEMIQAVEPVCPIDHSPIIDTREAAAGVIRPTITVMERPDWPEAFYLLTHKSPQSYTLEAPSDFLLTVRVGALRKALETLMAELA